ncbi:hypothetical protein [Flammeovirga aprica]|uniref:Uncharacterized protein n=1 Tax=Flammeovirga aprica JL-4 TaxID=694437 RepID=A0A7X9P3R1_9BACT|nr:hypothetical protein [Flammeovirga aprica]NME68587.1 hypothetical protein [Flammeovirga aprica JL-4]
MKQALLITVILLLGQSIYCNSTQSLTNTPTEEKVAFEPIYFILGTLSDYGGRSQYVNRENQVDKYYPYEKPLADFLKKYIKTELNISIETVLGPSNHQNTYSPELSKQLNDFYGEEDKLSNDKFESDEQIYSFIAGVCYRYGERLENAIYKIKLSNSPKHQNCYESLKQIGCQKLFYKQTKSIPRQDIIYFKPTPKLMKYLKLIEEERIELETSFHNRFETTDTKLAEQIKLDYQKAKNEEAEKIKHLF